MTDAREILLRDLLHSIAADFKYDNLDIKTTAIPTTGANFSSQLFQATIKSAGKRDLNVFAKAAVVGETMREQAGCSNFFDTEPFFYTATGKKYKEIEDKYNVPEENRLNLPKFYGYKGDYLKEILVLQDLSKEGFVTWDRLESVDWDYASKAIEELAKFHSLSLAHQKEYPEDYEEAKKVFKKIMMEENDGILNMFGKSLEKVVQLTREENKEKVNQFFHEIIDLKSFMKFYLPKKRPVLIHSDYRQSNLMHKVLEDGKLQVTILDYQTLHPGSVAIDLLYFIFLSSDGAFRAQYYDQLIEHYYDNMAAALRRLDLDPDEVFPRADFDEELKELLPFGLMISSMLLPIITVDLDQVTKDDGSAFENESFETMTDMMSNPNAICAQRWNEIVNDYIKWGVL